MTYSKTEIAALIRDIALIAKDAPEPLRATLTMTISILNIELVTVWVVNETPENLGGLN